MEKAHVSQGYSRYRHSCHNPTWLTPFIKYFHVHGIEMKSQDEEESMDGDIPDNEEDEAVDSGAKERDADPIPEEQPFRHKEHDIHRVVQTRGKKKSKVQDGDVKEKSFKDKSGRDQAKKRSMEQGSEGYTTET
eukprot:1163821-Amphidinium_carterae.1